MIHFKCQHCGTSIKVPAEFGGKKGKCPSCKKLVEVPKASAESDVGLAPLDEEAVAKPPPAVSKPAAAKQPAAIQKKPVPAKAPAAKASPPPAARAKRPAPPEDEDDVEVIDVVAEAEEIEEDVEIVAEEPPRKGRGRLTAEEEDDVEEDVDVVPDDVPRKGRKRPVRNEEEDEEDEPPRKPAKRPRDEDEDQDEEEEEERPRRGRKQPVVAEEEDEPEEEEEEEDRPRRKKKGGRRGEWEDCPECGCPGHAEKVSYTWWGGILAPKLFSIVECNKCGTRYNGKTGGFYTVGMVIYLVVAFLIIGGIFGLAAFIYFSRRGQGDFGQLELPPRTITVAHAGPADSPPGGAGAPQGRA